MAETIMSGLLFEDELQAWADYHRVTPGEQEPRDLHELLTDTAAEHHDRLAIVAPDGELTYGQLLRRAMACCHGMAQLGVRPGDLVGLVADRALDSYVLIYATTLMGAAYVPVASDPVEPAVDLLRRAGVSLLVAADPDRLAGFADRTGLVCRTTGQLCAEESGTSVTPAAAGDEALLYVIHTSGTTGVPKGVCIPRHGMRNLALWYASRHEVGPGDRLSQNAPLTFDPSAQQMFSAWVAGAAVHVIPDEVRVDPHRMLRWLADTRITHLDMVTAHWTQLCAVLESDGTRLPDLRWSIVAGETMYFAQCERWFRALGPDCRLQNIYGPTETTVNATQFEVNPAEIAELSTRSAKVPIGTPLPNYRVYLVDEFGELCAPGVVGEIVVAGEGLATGYLNAPDRTAERFVEMSLQGQPPARVYRTGDIAELVDLGEGRWTLQFRGRRDRQIKLSGYRIELDAIELAIEACDGVEHVSVLPLGDPADRLACAYSGSVSPERLLEQLTGRLAAHIVFSDVVRLDSLPVTSSGKVDQGALRSALEAQRRRQPARSAPRDDIERTICEVWASELDQPSIGPEDRFFARGGTSLSAFRIVARLTAAGVDVRATDLLRDPTAAQCADIARSRSTAMPAKVATESYVLVEWTNDREELRKHLHDVRRTDSGAWEPAGPVGPLTEAYLTRKRPVAATACIELIFDSRYAPAAVATALQHTIDGHEALRTRWTSTDRRAPLQVAPTGTPVAVVTIPDGHPDDVDALRGLVAEAGAHGSGLAAATVAVVAGSAHLMLYVPHALVDGTALSVITHEILDRVQGLTPDSGVATDPVLAELHARAVQERTVRGPAIDATWQRFLRADRALSALLSGRSADTGIESFLLPLPAIAEGDEITWMCSIVTTAIADLVGRAQVPVSVVGQPGTAARAPVVANLFDAVPLLIERTAYGREQFTETARALETATRLSGHWGAQALAADPLIGQAWAHSEYPLVGAIRVQRGGGAAMRLAPGVGRWLPGPSVHGNEPWIEVSDGHDGQLSVVAANIDRDRLRQFRDRLRHAAEQIPASAMRVAR